MKKIISACLISIMMISILSSCVTKTNVTFNTDVPGAEVYVDGEYIGTTPITKKMSNAVWEDPNVVIKKDGYHNMTFSVRKEIKIVNLLFSVFLQWWPSLLWVYGPKAHQYYILSPLK